MSEINDGKGVTYDFDPAAQGTREDLAEYLPLHTENYVGLKEDFIEWLLCTGKSPTKGEGYAEVTASLCHVASKYLSSYVLHLPHK